MDNRSISILIQTYEYDTVNVNKVTWLPLYTVIPTNSKKILPAAASLIFSGFSSLYLGFHCNIKDRTLSSGMISRSSI